LTIWKYTLGHVDIKYDYPEFIHCG
jgi:hypothetical protein